MILVLEIFIVPAIRTLNPGHFSLAYRWVEGWLRKKNELAPHTTQIRNATVEVSSSHRYRVVRPAGNAKEHKSA